MDTNLEARAQKIKLVIFDVDGVMRWALVEILSFEVLIPRSFNPLISSSNTAGSITTPLPITGTTFGERIPEGSK